MNVLYKSRNWFGRQAGTISLTKSDLENAATCIDCSSEGMEEGRMEMHRTSPAKAGGMWLAVHNQYQSSTKLHA